LSPPPFLQAVPLKQSDISANLQIEAYGDNSKRRRKTLDDEEHQKKSSPEILVEGRERERRRKIKLILSLSPAT
jgi:hypothetical protein